MEVNNSFFFSSAAAAVLQFESTKDEKIIRERETIMAQIVDKPLFCPIEWN